MFHPLLLRLGRSPMEALDPPKTQPSTTQNSPGPSSSSPFHRHPDSFSFSPSPPLPSTTLSSFVSSHLPFTPPWVDCSTSSSNTSSATSSSTGSRVPLLKQSFGIPPPSCGDQSGEHHQQPVWPRVRRPLPPIPRSPSPPLISPLFTAEMSRPFLPGGNFFQDHHFRGEIRQIPHSNQRFFNVIPTHYPSHFPTRYDEQEDGADFIFREENMGDNVDISLTAPALNQWFHGKQDRLTAEKRLLTHGKNGSYLVRESDRNANCYVLSYLGSSGINHFRIAAVCGEFFIGGRKFDSLSHLIGFYTSCYDLLQCERLVHPVAPTEPVREHTRVIAIHPYNRVPDTDELSFYCGDILTVQNDLSHYCPGWLWCTNLRTFESGLVFKELVQELEEDVDPNDLFPWYHNNISKEEAVDKLAKMGPGSFLVRKSERSPGNYSLFFHINNTVQRFRIERVGNRYIMGGRTFDSLDAVIKRYQHEQIVEGHCLGDPVLRPPLQLSHPALMRRPSGSNSYDSGEDVYATLRENKEVAQKRQSVWKKGYLFKKSLKNMKWKYHYFALNAKDQQLCFFENEKRVKPKGLVDLSYSYLYPVHDSLFERPFCFQLVERTIPCISTYYYLCADSAESAFEWMQALGPLCAPQVAKKNPSKDITEVRTLYLTLYEAHRLPVKLLPHPYCLLSLNQVKVARTLVKCPPDPTWEEEFVLEDIPVDVSTFSVTILNKRKESKSTEVANIELELSSLKSGEEIEKLFPLNGLQTPLRDDYGSIRLKIRFVHEIIMPFGEYNILKELIMNQDLEVIGLLEEFCHRDRGPLAHALLRIFRFERKEMTLIKSMIEREVKQETETNTLFRMNSLTTTLMDQYMRSTCESFLSVALREPLKRVFDTKQSCELNPGRLESLQEACANAEHLLSLLDSVVDSIFHSIEACPQTVRFLCGCLQRSVLAKWPNDPFVKTRVVGSFIFLRLLCPAILNPRQFGLIEDTPTEVAARSLILIAKCLQNLANLVEFGNKGWNHSNNPYSNDRLNEDESPSPPPSMPYTREPWMEIVNPFILKNKARVIKFFDDIAMVYDYPEPEEVPRGDPCRELATIHTICELYMNEINSLSHSRSTLKKLSFVTDLLSKHRNRCVQGSH